MSLTLTLAKPKLNILPNRNRMVQAETVCKLLQALCTGRATLQRLSELTGLSKKTVSRYLVVVSTYFPVVDERVGQQLYFWLETLNINIRANAPTRFCPKGHDKFEPHGGYKILLPEGKFTVVCAKCRRASNNKWYAGKGKAKRKLGAHGIVRGN